MFVRSPKRLVVSSVLIRDYEQRDGKGLLFEAQGQPFFIKREATYEEYYKACVEELGPPPADFNRAQIEPCFYYEVSTD